MLSSYDTAELIVKWGTINSPTVEQMIGYMLQNMMTEEAQRKKNSRDLIRQQTLIEGQDRKMKVLEEENEALKDEVIDLKARVKLLEEHASLRRKENGQE